MNKAIAAAEEMRLSVPPPKREEWVDSIRESAQRLGLEQRFQVTLRQGLAHGLSREDMESEEFKQYFLGLLGAC